MPRGDPFLSGEEAGGEGRDEDDAQSDGQGHRHRVHAVSEGLSLPSAHQMVHGDIEASAGDQAISARMVNTVAGALHTRVMISANTAPKAAAAATQMKSDLTCRASSR